jgi:hypothetical protein
MTATTNTNQKTKREKRRVLSPDSLAAAASIIRQRGLNGIYGFGNLKQRLALAFVVPEEPVTARTMTPKPEDRTECPAAASGSGSEPKKQKSGSRKTELQAQRRIRQAHQIYSTALSKNCHFFLVFLL